MNNAPIISAGKGLLLFDTRQQVLTTPVAPGATSQTVTLATGTYSAWVLGPAGATGTITAGTGAATGLGAAVPGAPNIFTVTTAGTFNFATRAAVTFCQLENGSEPTSFMPSAMTRAISAVSLMGQAFTDIFGGLTAATIVLDVIPQMTTAYASSQFLVSLSDGTANNMISVFRANASGNLSFRYIAGGTGNSPGALGGQAPQHRSCRIAYSYGAGPNAVRQVVNGGAAGFASPPAAPSGLNVFRFGADPTGAFPANALIRRLTIIPGIIPEYTARTYAPSAA